MSHVSRLQQLASASVSSAAERGAAHHPGLAARIALVAMAGLAAAAAFQLGAARAVGLAQDDTGLATVIRFMVTTKVAIALGLAVLVEWRLRHAASPGLMVGLILSTALAVAGPTLMWHLADLRLGAAFYYAGLAGLGLLAWLDRGMISALLAQAVARRRRR